MPDNPQDETWKAGREEKPPAGDPTPNDGWTDADFSEIRRRVTETAKQRAEAAKEGRLNTITGGQMGTPVEDVHVNYLPTQDEVIWPTDQKERNSAIVFGKDKAQRAEYGPYNGLQGSYAVDIVVGRLSSQRGRAADNTTISTPFYGADAARIYISQRTDIDKNFGLAGRDEKGKSGIGIKADGVRIIGRRGVKIVTGRMKGQNETDSKGNTIPTASPIELIGGNSTGERQVTMSLNAAGATATETIKTLQPLLKGDNTVAAFKELSEILDRLMGALLNMVLIQASFNSTIGVTVYPLAHHVSAGAISATQLLANVQNSIYHSRINKTMWELNHLETVGGKYICSKNVFAT